MTSDPKRWRLASFIALALMVPLFARLALDAGITWDEPLQYTYGDHVLAWYRSGFEATGALTYRNLYLYGGLFDLPAQWIVSTGWSPWGPYETRHVLTSQVALLGIVAVWLAANRIAGPRAGFVAGAVLALTPAWFGHGLFNPKDIPFATASAFVLYACVCIALRPAPLTWGDALRAALSLGVALGVRPGGMFLIAFPFATALLRAGVEYRERRDDGVRLPLRGLAGSIARLAALLPLTWALMLSAWPWAQLDPLLRPLLAARYAARFGWNGTMMFDGRVVSSRNLPDSYLPVWFGVTLPEIYFLAAFAGVALLVFAVRARRFSAGPAIALLVVAGLVLLPFVAAIALKPTMYDAHRHFLFVLPGLALLAGLGLERFAAAAELPRWLRGAVIAAALLGSSITLYDMWSLHPYQYIHFNRLSGGLPRQVERFESDYWGASYREGFEWVVRNYDPGGTRRVTVSACNLVEPVRYFQQRSGADRFEITARSRSEVDLAFTRSGCRNRPGEVLHVVKRQGAPLLYVRRNPPRR